ncbi:MAG: family N-acetyltransferase [Firmicutes bacterium]|nr:family N-acetyltransferase [Bacillota bacterium]
MKIRLAKDDDIKSIAKIHINNWKNTYRGSFPSDYLDGLKYNDAEKEWMKYLEQEDAFIYLAVSEENIIFGFAACKMNTETPCSSKLDSLHVNELNRGQGIAKQLILAIAKHFQARQINSMTLWAVETNEHAISIYKHLGAKIYNHEIRHFDWVKVRQVGLIWNDISCLCKKMG